LLPGGLGFKNIYVTPPNNRLFDKGKYGLRVLLKKKLNLFTY
jgi:hypothetical protein